MLLFAGVVAIALQSLATARERDAASADAARVEAANDAMMLMFRDEGEARQAGTITAHELVDGTARKMVATLDPKAPESASAGGALSELYVGALGARHRAPPRQNRCSARDTDLAVSPDRAV